jgi:ubiquinone/menaquinone biosynthesis C-methylase UbiE
MIRDKGYKGIGMEGWIATWYARNTWRDITEFRSLADRLAKDTPANSHILEVAPGPGYLSIELAKRGRYEIKGLDISKSFVEIAKGNAQKELVKVDFRQGNASAMPFDENTFDLVVCRAAFKNFSQPVEAINEMYRVLKPGGRAIIIDLRKDASLGEIDAYIRKMNLGWLNSLTYKFTFRFLLIPRAYTKEQFTHMAAKSRFGQATINESEIGFEVIFQKIEVRSMTNPEKHARYRQNYMPSFQWGGG